MSNNEPISEQFRLIGKEWAELDKAANVLEDCKSAYLSQRMIALGDMPVSRAESIVKASPDWSDYITKMADAREKANIKKVEMEVMRMRFYEWQSYEANSRAERRM